MCLEFNWWRWAARSLSLSLSLNVDVWSPIFIETPLISPKFLLLAFLPMISFACSWVFFNMAKPSTLPGSLTDRSARNSVIWWIEVLLERWLLWYEYIHPRSLTWNLKISPWKRRFLLETIIFRFHVKLWGCIYLEAELMVFQSDLIWMYQPRLNV